MTEIITPVVELELSAGNWTDVKSDILSDEKFRLRYGIFGQGPTDFVASPGSFDFSLDNSANNSGGLQGYYSPGHTNCRSGFELGIGVRVGFSYAQTYYKFRGKLKSIKPEAGRYGKQITKCRAEDWIAEASRIKPRAVKLRENMRADELLDKILEAIDNQPPATSFETGKSEFSYAFDEIVDGETTILQLLRNIAISEFGYISPIGDTDTGSKLKFWNRHSRLQSTASLATLNDETDSDSISGIVVEDADNLIFNDILATTYPRTVDDTDSYILGRSPARNRSLSDRARQKHSLAAIAILITRTRALADCQRCRFQALISRCTRKIAAMTAT